MSEPTPDTVTGPRSADRFTSGMVTVPGAPSPVPPGTTPESPRGDGPRRRRRQMLIFAGIAGAILTIGLAVILVVVLTNGGDPFRSTAPPPPDLRPPLARACPPPTASPSAAPPARPSAPPPVSGPRTTDPEAGISYRAYGSPWQPWNEVWRAGTLSVPYKVGQHFVTESYSQGDYHASILSAAVPATDNDAAIADLTCVGQQVVADVRAEYYPQPNTLDRIREGLSSLGGRPAYVSVFRLHFREQGLTATSELSAVAVIDVGRSTAAVLYVSIPSTHRQFDGVVDEVLASVRPT